MKAVYAGSFDPFTNGHMDIVRKASKLFDKVYVVVAVNYDKKRKYNTIDTVKIIAEALEEAGIENVEVHYWSELVVEFCRVYKADYIIRGLRTPGDYAYEENIATINKELAPEIETVYFRADSSFISSSMVRELVKYGKTVDKYVPTAVSRMIRQVN